MPRITLRNTTQHDQIHSQIHKLSLLQITKIARKGLATMNPGQLGSFHTCQSKQKPFRQTLFGAWSGWATTEVDNAPGCDWHQKLAQRCQTKEILKAMVGCSAKVGGYKERMNNKSETNSSKTTRNITTKHKNLNAQQLLLTSLA